MKLCFFLASNVRSGANLSMLHHAAYAAAEGHQVLVLFQYRFFDAGLDYFEPARHLPTAFLDEYPADPPQQDVVIINWWLCAFDLPRIPARRYAYYRHGDEQLLYESRVFDALIGAVLQERFLWFAVSPALASDLVAAGHSPIVLPNGVDNQAFAAAAPSLPPKTARLRVLVEGPLSTWFKRVEPTVAALRAIADIEIVHMAADGSRPATPVDHALGAVPHHATPGIYAACDLIVKLSTAPECTPMPVLEQFAAGGTAVVTRFPGPEQYIDASNAIFIDAEPPFAAAAAAVQRLSAEPETLARLRAAARATAQRFDWNLLRPRFLAALSASVDATATQTLPIIERYAACQRDAFALWAATQQKQETKKEDSSFLKTTAKRFLKKRSKKLLSVFRGSFRHGVRTAR